MIKFCLGATNFHKAMAVARDPAAMREAAEMKIWGDDEIGNIWISGTTSNLHDGQFVRPFPFKQT